MNGGNTMNGKVTVELVDSKGNKEVYQKDNLVTNAHKNIFPSLTKFWNLTFRNGVSNNNDFLKNLYTLPDNFVKSMFGGLLVFSDNLLTPTADRNLPTADDISKYVGCANSKTSSVGTMKGTFNTQESEFTNSYAKFVWNFSASQIYNKDVGAFALTSDLGGQHGLGNTLIESGAKADSIIYPYMGTMWDLSNGTEEERAAKGLTEMSIQDDSVCTFSYYDDQENKLHIGLYRSTEGLTKRVIDLSKYKIDELYNGSFGIVDSTQEVTYAPTYTPIRYEGIEWLKLRGNNSPYLYMSRRAWGTGNDYHIIRTSIADGSQTDLGELPSTYIDSINNYAGTGNPQGCVVVESGTPYHYVYKLSSDKTGLRVWKCNISSGTWTHNDITFSAECTEMLGLNYTQSPTVRAWAWVNDSLYIPSFTNFGVNIYNLFKVNSDLTFVQVPVFQWRGGSLSGVFLNEVKLPIAPEPVLFSEAWSPEYYKPVILTSFLSTICNLDTVLHKGADKTMKVTYTLYNGSQPN